MYGSVLVLVALVGQFGPARPLINKVSTPPEYAFTPVMTGARTEHLEATMKQKIDLNFDQRALRDVFEFLHEKSKLNFHPDAHAKKAHEDLLDLPVTIHASDLRLDSALDLVLHDHDLAWGFRDETVIITTALVAKAVVQTRVFGIADLLLNPSEIGGWAPANYMIEIITSLVAPTTWSEVGGAGGIKYDPVTKSLVITQTYRVIDEISTLLGELRQSRNLQAGDKDQDAEPSAVLYRLPHGSRVPHAQGPANAGFSPIATVPNAPGDNTKLELDESVRVAKQFAEVIPQVIEPKSWQANGGSGLIFAVGDQLVVRQTAKVHAEINKLLARPAVQPIYQAGGTGS